MKEAIQRIKEFYDAKNIGFYLSHFALFVIGYFLRRYLKTKKEQA